MLRTLPKLDTDPTESTEPALLSDLLVEGISISEDDWSAHSIEIRGISGSSSGEVVRYLSMDVLLGGGEARFNLSRFATEISSGIATSRKPIVTVVMFLPYHSERLYAIWCLRTKSLL